MKLSKEEVLNIAKLARLELTDEEVKTYGKQLSKILDYFNKLQEIDTKGVEETSQVTGLINVYRSDVVEPSNIEAELIKQAPDSEDNQVRVKNVL